MFIVETPMCVVTQRLTDAARMVKRRILADYPTTAAAG
jgi:hypothetical protein